MKRAKTGAIFFGALLLTGCNIRMVAVLETEDAIYGETKIEKAQKYDPEPKQKEVGFFEALVGVFNSDSAKAYSDGSSSTAGVSPVLP